MRWYKTIHHFSGKLMGFVNSCLKLLCVCFEDILQKLKDDMAFKKHFIILAFKISYNNHEIPGRM